MADAIVSAEAAEGRGFDVRLALAFAAIYVLWGTTFLAIRIAVNEMPPLFAAGVRFLTAGVLLYGWTRVRGQVRPTGRQWKNLLVIAVVMFVADYSALFWAEKYLTSGVAAILAATIPLMTVALEIFPFRTQPFRWIIVGSSVLGFAGVAVLMLPGGGDGIALLPCVAILLGSVGWAVGSILQQRMSLPASRAVTSAATMMLGGAVLLALSAAFGEMQPFPHVSVKGALALGYLIFGGSLVAFTAYVWLLGRMPASKVASYAYVNPLVAVAIGYFAAKEPVTARMMVGMALVLVSVFLTLRAKDALKAKV